MKRVYCTSILTQGSTYELEKKYYIHLVKVMRLKVGDQVSLFNNTSGEWKSEIVDIKNNLLIAKTISLISPPKPDTSIDLMFSPIKYQNSESIIRQCTEMGIRSIFPTIFKRTINTKINLNKFSNTLFLVTSFPGKSINALSITFFNSLILSGHKCLFKAVIASFEIIGRLLVFF